MVTMTTQEVAELRARALDDVVRSLTREGRTTIDAKEWRRLLEARALILGVEMEKAA